MNNRYEKDNINFSHKVVDLRQLFSVPISTLRAIAEKQEYRLRLLPPYREHLSQAFARVFMRVGLPTDINIDEVKFDNK